MNAWGIVVAAGSGARLGGGTPKTLRVIGGAPMFVHAIRSIERAVSGVALVVPMGWNDDALEKTLAHRYLVPVELVHGGATRASSVAAGLAVVPDDVEAIVVHDAARPLASPVLAERALGALADADGAVCAVPLADTLKRATDGVVVETVPRAGLWRAQTPQAFRAASLRRAHEHGGDATDDAGMVEAIGGRVVLVEGDEHNIKVTTAEDFALAEVLMEGRG